MALTMSGATYGFDNNGVQSLINALELNVVEATITAMTQGLSTLQTTVDAGWVGNSAETFKSNMLKDKETVSESLKEAKDTLKSELFDIANELDQADSELVQKRGD